MKKSVLGGLGAVLSVTSALAADLPSRRAPPVYVPPVPVFTWTGLYIGAQAGYAFGRDTTSYAVTGNGAVFESTSSSPSGVIGGGHVGYNFSTQSLPILGSLGSFGGSGLVIGIEGDVDGSSYRRGNNVALLTNGAFASVRSDIGGSVRGRLGIAVDKALFYATGGAAFADFRNSTSDVFGTDVTRFSRLGYTVGGGVEYAFLPQVSARVEYRYSDYARYSSNLANSTLTAFDARHHETIQRVEVGLSYHFATPVAPVVARY